MKYSKIAYQSKKVLKIMQDIEYGFKDDTGFNLINNPDKWDQEFNDFYYLQTPEELLKSKCGVCWDQVELERKLFMEQNILIETYFIVLVANDMLPSHTFLIYQDASKYYWLENSWASYRGIHEYKNKEELLKDVQKKFIKSHPEVDKKAQLYLFKYQKPKDHITCNEFYQYIETQEQIIL